MESRAVRAAPFRGLRHTLRRREPGGPRRQAEVARRRVRWDRFPGIGRGKYGDEMGWRRVDHGDVARAAVQAAPHAIDAARVLSSRSGSKAKNASETWRMPFIFEITGVRFFPQPMPRRMRWK